MPSNPKAYSDTQQSLQACKTIMILQADDDEEDQMMTLRALQEGGVPVDVQTVNNGEELLAYLQHNPPYTSENAPRPALILLDLNMPIMDGKECLIRIKDDPILRTIPVIVFTTSKSESEIQQIYNYGASAYLVKPVKYQDYVQTLSSLKTFWLQTVSLPPFNATKNNGLYG